MLQNTPRSEAVGGGVSGGARNLLLAERAQFRKEAEYWTLGYAGTRFRLKDTKGLAYIADLLRYPGTKFHALNLARGGATFTESREHQPVTLPINAQDLDNAGIPGKGVAE